MPNQRSYADLLALLLLCTFALVITLPYYDRVLYDHDDGLIGVMAQLTRAGLRSHVDFFDPYSGLLNCWHATFFGILGESLRAMRIAMMVAFMITLPVVFAICRSLFTLGKSIAMMLVWIVWSLPQYIASMPSWYNVFLNFAAIGFFAIYLKRRSPWTLWAAGVVTGLSISVKVIGLYLLIASLLFLLYDSQSEPSRAAPRMRPFAWLISAAGLLVIVGACVVLRRHLTADYLVFFVLPLCAPWVHVIARERTIDLPLATRFRSVVWLRTAPYVGGIFLVCMGWFLRYPSLEQLVKVLRGIFVLPHRRAESVTFLLPALPLPIYPMLLISVLLAARYKRPQWIQLSALGIMVGLTLFWTSSTADQATLAITWNVTYRLLLSAVPCLLIGSFALLSRRKDNALGFLISALACYFQLVMYPFSTPTYFAYSFSLVLLVGAMMLEDIRYFRVNTVALFGTISMIVGVLTIWVLHMPALISANTLLATQRGMVRFTAEQTNALNEIIAFVDRTTPPGATIYAGPDAPEILFLTGRQHVGGFIIEGLEDFDERTLVRKVSSLDFAIVKHGVDERFSGQVHAALAPTLQQLLPHERRLGPYSIFSKSSDEGSN